MGSSRFKRPPGAIFGHVPDAAAKLPTTSADRSFMMATAREQANYKRLSWCRALAQMIGFCAAFQPSLLPSTIHVLILRRQGPVNTGPRPATKLASRVIRKPTAQNEVQQQRRNTQRARERCWLTRRTVRAKKAAAMHPLAVLLCPHACTSQPSSPRTARAIEQGTSDAERPADE